MNRCDDMRELMSARMDGVLEPAGEKRLSGHLASCAACREDLAALERTLQALHALPAVKPPADLTARIRARIRAEQQPRRSRIIDFLSLPQTRVALAASLLVVVTTLGVRQMLSAPRPASQPQPDAPQAPAVAAAPAPALKADGRQDATRKGAPPAEALLAEEKQRGQAETKRQAEAPAPAIAEKAKMEAAIAPKAMNAAVAAPAAAYRYQPAANDRVGGAGGGAVADGGMLDAAMPAAEMIAAKPAASADNLAADKLYENRSMAKATAARSVVAPGRVEPALAPAVTPPSASAPPRPVSLAAGAAPSRMRVADVEQESAALRRSAAEGYTFRTERAAAAAAIVNRYAAKKLEQAQAADGIRAKEAAVARDEAKDAQPVTVEVTLAASDLPALLEELRRAGAQLVAQPAADMKNIAAPAPASRATSRPARTGYAASPAAPAAAPAASMAAAAQAADVDSAPLFAGATAVTDAPAAASAPATVTVRFTFLPPAP